MPTTYTVLRETTDEDGKPNGLFRVLTEDVVAPSPKRAREQVAGQIPDSALDNGESVNLAAIPSRNWESVTLRPETTRRFR